MNHMNQNEQDNHQDIETDGQPVPVDQNDEPENLLNQLNPNQREAVLYFDSPLLVIAGAGSGKTKVITNKIAYLVRSMNYSPRNILGVTFTNKAAEEMKHRIQSLTGIQANQFNIFTFHALGLRILRESGSVVGLDSQWQVMDDSDQRKIIERIIKNHFNHYTSDMRETVRRKIGFAKMELNYPNNKEYLYQKGFTDEEVRIYTLYYKFQCENKVWDYEDLVSLPVKILQNNEQLRQKYASRFKFVVVDEFQDTNPNQYELLTLIAGDKDHRKITIVGDDDQAVYSWRGASIRFLFDFENDFPNAKIIKLEQNYRSTPQVLDFANNLISHNTNRRDKEMWTDGKSGAPVFIVNTTSKESEASEVATLIKRLKDSEADVFPLAILYRINSQSLAFETEFARRNISFKILKGLRFFDRKEVKDSMALLKLTVNLADDISFLRIVDFLPLGIGSKTLETLSQLAEEHRLSLFSTLQQHLPDKFNSRDLFSIIHKLHQEYHSGQTTLSQLLERILRASGYTTELEEKKEMDRLMNIQELSGFIKNWEKENPDKEFTHLIDSINLDGGAKKDESDTSVFLLTMHNAKGLEFPTVVVAGVNTNFMPYFLRKGRQELEEERRLFYVASTRAIKQLVISTGSERPSPFISNIRRSLYSIAYSIDDVVSYWFPMDSGSSLKELASMAAGQRYTEEKFLEHAIFGRGKIINDLGNNRYIVDFVKKGEKTIDASIAPVTFL